MRAALRVGLLLFVAPVAMGCASLGIPQRLSIPASGVSVATLDTYLLKPAGPGPHPAVVFLHGCGGLFSVSSGQMQTREQDWARRLVDLGYVVLMVDSFSTRNVREMCSKQGYKPNVYSERPKDAYAALRYLQQQSFVRPDRIAAMGWSQGGGVILLSVRADSLGRPTGLTHDFRTAVAFYPGSCREQAHRLPWSSTTPLLVLLGEHDNWTPAEPCRRFVELAVGRGSPIELKIYPGAYHDFDWPNLAVHQLPAYRTSAGVVPVAGTDPAAREDALARVTAFLAKHLKN